MAGLGLGGDASARCDTIGRQAVWGKPMRKLRETVYHVNNLEAAITHYTTHLGGKLVKQLPWGVAFIDIDGEGGLISLFDLDTYYAENPSASRAPGPKVVISTDDLDQLYGRLTRNGVRVGPILGEAGDIRGFESFDPDGNAVFFLDDPSGQVSEGMSAV